MELISWPGSSSPGWTWALTIVREYQIADTPLTYVEELVDLALKVV